MPHVLRLSLAALLLFSAGCIAYPYPRHREVVVVHKPGPPPHAPAHGRRAKHRADEPELVFDKGIGVYVVVGWENHFFLDDHYYRFVDGGWQISLHLRDGWSALPARRVPKTLRARYARPQHGHRGYPARHGD